MIFCNVSSEGHGATAVIGLKDADLALEAAMTADMPLPSTHVWRSYLVKAIERGEGHQAKGFAHGFDGKRTSTC